MKLIRVAAGISLLLLLRKLVQHWTQIRAFFFPQQASRGKQQAPAAAEAAPSGSPSAHAELEAQIAQQKDVLRGCASRGRGAEVDKLKELQLLLPNGHPDKPKRLQGVQRVTRNKPRNKPAVKGWVAKAMKVGPRQPILISAAGCIGRRGWGR